MDADHAEGPKEEPPEERIAVLFIQGMGEQLPMDTLRDFVAAVTMPADDETPPPSLFNKPDRLSDGTDLRRLTLPGKRPRPTADFLDFYWTPEFTPGRTLGVVRWTVKYAARPFFLYKNHTTRTMIMWFQILTVLAAAILYFLGWLFHQWNLDTMPIVWIPLLAVALSAAVWAWYFMGHFLSDVLRYFSPLPRDIPARDRIRRRGVELIKKLHSGDEYTRIIVVGHSLGSAIGYDILRIAWDALRLPDDDSGSPIKQSSAEQLESTGTTSVHLFQQQQYRLHRENATAGIPWKVSDFVTLGSPLTHAETILSNKRHVLAKKFAELELPTCPPSFAPGDKGAFYEYKRPENPRRSYLVGNSSAVFGPTRWTNLYFPSRRLLEGDPAGGPLAPVFGSGVRDVPVRLSYRPGRARVMKRVPFWSHSCYWSRQADTRDGKSKDREPMDDFTSTKDAVPALKSVIQL
ncbi:hypothetical protein [Arthrobacter sp. 35W]|uniref:hypothetical protein n=1 Tax=Arthrobacter sp. 35W TaxID=1132441 RepID=UPI0004267132|nr:hypothetical protein [Arthrobacter sp. 35W]